MKRLALLLVVGAITVGCDLASHSGVLQDRIDTVLFGYFGRTFLQDSLELPIGRVHLSQDRFAGELVVVEGSIVAIGRQRTYVVIESPHKERLLVVLVKSDGSLRELEEGSRIKVLGTLATKVRGVLSIEARTFLRV